MEKKYQDFLAKKLKPIYSHYIPSLFEKQPWYHPDDLKERAETIDFKMICLLDHFGIPKSRMKWKDLAYALAQAHVPGLQVAEPDKRTGAPTKWTDFKRGALVFYMEREMNQKKIGATQAAKNLVAKEPWKSFLDGNHNLIESLRKQYEDHKNNSQILGFAKLFVPSGVVFPKTLTSEEYELKLTKFVKEGPPKAAWK